MLPTRMSVAKRNRSFSYRGFKYITQVLLSHDKATERDGIFTQCPKKWSNLWQKQIVVK